MSIAHTLEFPVGFDERAWEVESKGWLQDTVATIGGARYRVVFYDPVRLLQEIEDELTQAPMFVERNLIVVRAVTRAHMEAAVAAIANTGRYKELIPDLLT